MKHLFSLWSLAGLLIMLAFGCTNSGLQPVSTTTANLSEPYPVAHAIDQLVLPKLDSVRLPKNGVRLVLGNDFKEWEILWDSPDLNFSTGSLSTEDTVTNFVFARGGGRSLQDRREWSLAIVIPKTKAQSGANLNSSMPEDTWKFWIHSSNFVAVMDEKQPFILKIDDWNLQDSTVIARCTGKMEDVMNNYTVHISEGYIRTKWTVLKDE
jgi:hypothetical protein